MELRDRYRGALLGLAVGDALGTTLEFKPEFKRPGTFASSTDMVGGGPFGLEPGQWNDDTSMALCLAESLIEWRGFDPVDQLRHYCRWYREGHLSRTGRCFDIGNTTQAALQQFERTGEPFPGPTDPRSAGNGSLMRLAPVVLAFASAPKTAIEMAGQSSRTTHRAREAVDACRYFAGLLIGALQGRAKAEVLAPQFSPVPDLWTEAPLAPKIAAAAGSFKAKNPPAIRGTGDVVDCLEAALWAFHQRDTFRDGALLAVNLGDDADTTGAVYGQLAGTHYGASGIPAEWLATLAFRELIETYADELIDLSQPAGVSAPRQGGILPGASPPDAAQAAVLPGSEVGRPDGSRMESDGAGPCSCGRVGAGAVMIRQGDETSRLK
jgi:ADP-ribosylglycohydrolase